MSVTRSSGHCCPIRCLGPRQAFVAGSVDFNAGVANRWTDRAINIESSEALADPASPPANDPGEPYRFGVTNCEGPD